MTPLDQVVSLGRLLDSLGVRWVLGGPLASSLVGEPRSTMDIDVAVSIDLDHVDRLVAAVGDQYYVSAEMAREAVLHGSSFNLIQGGESSERQWRDVLSILRVQGERIDRDQPLLVAGPLGLGDFVARVLGELNPTVAVDEGDRLE